MAQDPIQVKNQKIESISTGSEFEYIENAFVKIGTLLALGYGEAGASIIAENMQKKSLTNLTTGKKKIAIFGFCDIRNFTDATEVLQEDVMLFVNTIAQVVHNQIDLYLGAANKNIGDAFLLVWRFPDKFCEIDENGSMKLKDSFYVNNLADLALIGIIKTIIKLNTNL